MREEDFHEYRNGGSFAAFVKKTNREWFRLAKSLMQKLPAAPPSIDVEDVVQTMLLACTRFTFEWEPGRGPTLKTHVVWRACDKAIKMLHSELRTSRNGKTPRAGAPRFELCFSSLLSDERDLLRHRLAHVTPGRQEFELAKNEVRRDPLVAMFVETGDADVVATRVLENQALREKYGIRFFDTAKREVLDLVRRRVEEVVP